MKTSKPKTWTAKDGWLARQAKLGRGQDVLERFETLWDVLKLPQLVTVPPEVQP